MGSVKKCVTRVAFVPRVRTYTIGGVSTVQGGVQESGLEKRERAETFTIVSNKHININQIEKTKKNFFFFFFIFVSKGGTPSVFQGIRPLARWVSGTTMRATRHFMGNNVGHKFLSRCEAITPILSEVGSEFRLFFPLSRILRGK